MTWSFSGRTDSLVIMMGKIKTKRSDSYQRQILVSKESKRRQRRVELKRFDWDRLRGRLLNTFCVKLNLPLVSDELEEKCQTIGDFSLPQTETARQVGNILTRCTNYLLSVFFMSEMCILYCGADVTFRQAQPSVDQTTQSKTWSGSGSANRLRSLGSLDHWTC